MTRYVDFLPTTPSCSTSFCGPMSHLLVVVRHVGGQPSDTRHWQVASIGVEN